jgi:hypothetical protein
MRNAYTSRSVHFPLTRAALCLDCDACFELEAGPCPACGGEIWMPLARFLERRPSATHLTALLPAA